MLKIRIPDTHLSETTYILDVMVHDFWGLEYQLEVDGDLKGYEIINGSKKVTLPIIFFQNFESNKSKEPKVSTIETGCNAAHMKELPAWFLSKGEQWTLQADIIGMAFFLLTGFSDIYFSVKDDHQRDHGKSSFLVRNDIIDRPIIQEWFTVLTALLFSESDCRPGLRLPGYSKHISHDVDQPFEYLNYTYFRLLKRISGDILLRNNLGLAFHRVKKFVQVKLGNHESDPYNNFDALIKLLDTYNLKSTFFFVSGDSNSTFEVLYDIRHPALREIMMKVSKAGHHIGVHPTYTSFQDAELLEKEVLFLRDLCRDLEIQNTLTHSRKHYLRWDWESSPGNLEKAGISDDYTVGYADRTGYRSGVAFPYHAFNWRTREKMDLILHPLIVMECSLFADKYMGLSMEESENKILSYHNQLTMLGGEYVLLWHNHLLLATPEIELFTKFLSL